MAFAFFVLSQLDVMPGLRWQRRLRSAGVGIRTQQPNGRHGRHGRGNRLHLLNIVPWIIFQGKKGETWFWMVLVGGFNPLKNMSSSVGMILPNLWENQSHVPVTTN